MHTATGIAKKERDDLVSIFPLCKKWGSASSVWHQDIEKKKPNLAKESACFFGDAEGRDQLQACYFRWLAPDASVAWIPSVAPSMLFFFGPDRLNVGVVVMFKRIPCGPFIVTESREESEVLGKKEPGLIELYAALENADSLLKMEELKKSCEAKCQQVQKEQAVISEVYKDKKIRVHLLPELTVASIMEANTFIDEILSYKQSVIISEDLVGYRVVVLFTCYLLSKGWSRHDALSYVQYHYVPYISLPEEWSTLIDDFVAHGRDAKVA